LFGDIVWISFGSDGVSRRHHRSPALAIEPAGQDPGRAHDPQPCRNSDALFGRESQSFLGNIVAGLRHSRASKSSLSGAALNVCTQSAKKSQGDYSSLTIGSKSVGDRIGSGVHEMTEYTILVFIGGHIFAATKAEMDDVKAKYQAVGKDFDKVMTSAKAGVTATVNFVEAIQKLSAAKSANTEVVGLMRQGVELAYELLVANLHNKQADLTREAVIARKDGSTARLQGVSVE
jgi:hypothetical protein